MSFSQIHVCNLIWFEGYIETEVHKCLHDHVLSFLVMDFQDL